MRRISVPFEIVNAFPFQAHYCCLILALCIVFACYFCFCLSRFPLCKVSLPVAFDSYHLTRIEYHGSTTDEYGTELRFLLPILQFSWFLLHTASKKTVSIIFKDSYDYQEGFFSKFKDNSRTNCTFLEFQEFSRTKVIFPGLFKVCANPV